MVGDPNAIATWANLITVGRIVLSPVMFLVIPDHNAGSWLAFAMWFVLCVSDGIDGYLARRHGTTASGAFLDPLADKVLVLGAMFTLVTTDMFWIVPVAMKLPAIGAAAPSARSASGISAASSSSASRVAAPGSGFSSARGFTGERTIVPPACA